MALDYKTLVGDRDCDGSIKNWVNHDKAPSTSILIEAQAWIYERIRVRQMLTTLPAASLAIGAETIALPSDYRQPYFFMFTANASVAKSIPQYKMLDFVISQFNYQADGTRTRARPRYWATDAANIQFETESDKVYPYLFKYYAALADLGPTNQTNFLTSRYPRLLRTISVSFAYERLKNRDERIYYLKLAEDEVFKVNVDSDLELTGINLRMEIDGDTYGNTG